MESALTPRCDLIIAESKRWTETFRGIPASMALAAAYLMAVDERQTDPETLHRTERLLKAHTTSLSAFRSEIQYPLLAKMILSGDPEAFLTRTESVYRKLRDGSRLTGGYDVMAAIVLAEYVEADAEQALIDRTRDAYQKMKAQHPWMTSDEDKVYAAVWAVSGTPIQELAADAEDIYTRLQVPFGISDTGKSLSYMLVLSDQPAEATCAKLVRLDKVWKQAGRGYGFTYQLPALGLLSLVRGPEERLVAEMTEVDEYLKAGMDRSGVAVAGDIRRLYAAQVVAHHHLMSSNGSEAVSKDSVLALAMSLTAAMQAMISLLMSSTLLNL